MLKTILFRVDGGCVRDTGTGHISRCLLLAGELRGPYTLIFASLDRAEYEYGHAQIKNRGYRLHLLPPGRYHDSLRALVGSQKPDFIISDLYEYGEEELGILKSVGVPLMTFDHVETHRRYSDYPINALARPQENRFDGLDYIVVPRSRIRPIRQIPENVFISFGGFDYCDVTIKVASVLAALRIPQQVNIVVSDLYPRLTQLEGVARQAAAALIVHVQPDSFDDLLSDCDVALVSGGLTMFQALSVGASVVVISQYEHQRRTVEDFATSGAYVDLGMGGGVEEGRIKEVLTGLLADVAWRQSLGHNARTLVDGQGLERVVRVVTDALAA